MTGELEAMALSAGQSAGLVHELAPAARIVTAVASQAARILADGSRRNALAPNDAPRWAGDRNEEAK
jgi:hypothetical protein